MLPLGTTSRCRHRQQSLRTRCFFSETPGFFMILSEKQSLPRSAGNDRIAPISCLAARQAQSIPTVPGKLALDRSLNNTLATFLALLALAGDRDPGVAIERICSRPTVISQACRGRYQPAGCPEKAGDPLRRVKAAPAGGTNPRLARVTSPRPTSSVSAQLAGSAQTGCQRLTNRWILVRTTDPSSPTTCAGTV